MYSLVGGLAMDLLLAINSKVTREIPNVEYLTNMKDMFADTAKYSISYRLPEQDVFCILNISVTHNEADEIHFGAHAELNKLGFEEADVNKINIEDFMLELYPLKPIVSKGFTHYFASDENGKYNPLKPVARRTFSIKYRSLSKSIKTQDIMSDYRFGEMAEIVFPYIKSLYDVFKTIHPNPNN